MSTTPASYDCPNGHPFPTAIAIPCVACESRVLCVPLARLIDSRDQLIKRDCHIALLDTAIAHASYCLRPNQGERPDPVVAAQWLCTTFPTDHPNYVDPASLPHGPYNPDPGGVGRITTHGNPNNIRPEESP